MVDGVRLVLCPGCMRHGQAIQVAEKAPVLKKPVFGSIRKPVEKDIYKDMNKELVTGWNELIKKAREKKGFTREELGFRIGERTVTVSKLENGDLRPSDKMIEKLEKELGITLVENVVDVSAGMGGSHSGNRLTLGDFIKKADK